MTVQTSFPEEPSVHEDAEVEAPAADSIRRMQELIRGMAVTQMIAAACEVGLPDAVAGDGTSLTSLSERLKVDADVLTRLARALSSHGIFEVEADGGIRHNEASRLLRTTTAGPSLHWAARFWAMPGIWRSWGALGHCVVTGEEAFSHVNAQDFFSYMNGSPEEEALYQRYMASGYPGRYAAIADVLTVAPGERVIDVGGGTGSLARAILERNPDAHAVVYDQASVISAGPGASGNDRLSTQEGSFFDEVPPGGDVYVLSWILHDWPDEKAESILRNCRKAMDAGARLVVVDRVLQEAPQECDPLDLVLDLQMLVLHGGRERTLDDFERLLKAAGFSAPQVLSARPEFSVIQTRAV
ncbi:methyltransferase [Kitasatospora sp. NPDC057936]|uniref:methyltransferase n=1 Tax=Kitasatospora sp. NPDC057936 TaxID=3346283 RepID=UPI0036D7E3D1